MSRVLTRLTSGRIEAIRKSILDKAVPKSFSVFIAREADLPAIRGLAAQEFADDTNEYETYCDYLYVCHALTFGLKHGKDIACYGIFEFNRRQKKIYMVELVASKKYRGRGLSTWVLQKISEVGKTLGYKTLTSHVSPANKPAIKLYEKAGMSLTRRVKGYHHDGSDALYMRKFISR